MAFLSHKEFKKATVWSTNSSIWRETLYISISSALQNTKFVFGSAKTFTLYEKVC